MAVSRRLLTAEASRCPGPLLVTDGWTYMRQCNRVLESREGRCYIRAKIPRTGKPSWPGLRSSQPGAKQRACLCLVYQITCLHRPVRVGFYDNLWKPRKKFPRGFPLSVRESLGTDSSSRQRRTSACFCYNVTMYCKLGAIHAGKITTCGYWGRRRLHVGYLRRPITTRVWITVGSDKTLGLTVGQQHCSFYARADKNISRAPQGREKSPAGGHKPSHPGRANIHADVKDKGI